MIQGNEIIVRIHLIHFEETKLINWFLFMKCFHSFFFYILDSFCKRLPEYPVASFRNEYILFVPDTPEIAVFVYLAKVDKIAVYVIRLPSNLSTRE